MIGAGASREEAEEAVDSLWADCVAPRGDRPAKLRNYNGNCALQTWLNRIALNQWLNYKRWQQRWNTLIPERIVGGGEDDRRSQWASVRSAELATESSLLEMMREAVQAAFTQCPPEDFVLLQLHHADDLRVVELARIFDCGIGTISRRLRTAADGISTATIAHIRRTDPWLELQWEDFLELCREATPACFGLD